MEGAIKGGTMKKYSWLIFVWLGFATAICSCGGGGGGATLSSIAITPANPTVAVGATQNFTANGTYSDGSTSDVTASATWSSSDETKATIDTRGIATGIAEGTSTITASLDGKSASTTLTVGQSSLDNVDIVFTCGAESDLCGMKTDGTGQTVLKAADAFDESDSFTSMAFSADGNFIAYQANCSTNAFIRVMGNTLGNPTDLTPCDGKHAYQPAFSPDGTKIAFIASLWATDENGEYLYVMNADGTSPHRITPLYGVLNPSDGSPSFSADGTRIVFGTGRGGASYLATIKLDGSDYQFFDGGTGGADPVPADPTVDQVTGTIYYASAQVATLNNKFNIYNISLTGTGKVAQTNDLVYDLGHPSVSQDGSMAVFTQAVDFSTQNIQLLNIGTGVVTTISDPAFFTYNEWPVFVRR